ncbi:MAG: DNA repair protein RecO, partial [Gammaproteobacteria bacterium]
MTGPVQQEPAYVLHRRPYRETSLLVDLFTLNHGRMTVVARGANTAKSALKAQLQPFQPLLLDWQGRGDLKNLTQAEARHGPVIARTVAMYSGLYINELLQKLLPPADPHPDLFATYIDTLCQLADSKDVEPVLRRFEQAFAHAMGLGFDWDHVTDTGAAVTSGRSYYYDPEQGVLCHPPQSRHLSGLEGDTLLAIAAGDLESDPCRRLAKRVMRMLVDFLMQGRPLHSRSLFSHGRGESN